MWSRHVTGGGAGSDAAYRSRIRASLWSAPSSGKSRSPAPNVIAETGASKSIRDVPNSSPNSRYDRGAGWANATRTGTIGRPVAARARRYSAEIANCLASSEPRLPASTC